MLFNVSKIRLLLVGKAKDYCSLNIGDEVVHPVKTVKDLGIYVKETYLSN